MILTTRPYQRRQTSPSRRCEQWKCLGIVGLELTVAVWATNVRQEGCEHDPGALDGVPVGDIGVDANSLAKRYSHHLGNLVRRAAAPSGLPALLPGRARVGQTASETRGSSLLRPGFRSASGFRSGFSLIAF